MAIRLHRVGFILEDILVCVLKQASHGFAGFTCLCFNGFNADKTRINPCWCYGQLLNGIFLVVISWKFVAQLCCLPFMFLSSAFSIFPVELHMDMHSGLLLASELRKDYIREE